MKNNNEAILINFGKQIQTLRKSKRMSQEDLASLTSLHRTYIGMIERGEKNTTLKNIQKLAKALNISISDLTKDL